MMRYAVLDLVVLLIIGGFYLHVQPALSLRRLLWLLTAMLTLTVLFDNIIVGLHIVAYQQAHILGWYIGHMPIEDLAYTVAACLLVPLLWGKEPGNDA